MNTAIYVSDLSHIYESKKGKVTALKNLNLDINKGEIFGILGPNGAGKTTLIKILSTLLIPMNGNVEILGYDILKFRNIIRKEIGLISSGERGLYWKLTGKENLKYFAELNNLKSSSYKQKINEILEFMGLSDSKDKLVSTYSKGMKQRLHIARGLLTDPKILFMDEPTSGLDIEVSKEMQNLIKDLSKEGKTIVYTTHYMKEAEELCDRIAFLKKGRLVELNTPEYLTQSLKGVNITRIEFQEVSKLDVESIVGKNMIFNKINDFILEIEVPLENNVPEFIFSNFKTSKIKNFSVKKYDLEDVYLNLMKRVDD
ncbi:ABC transporter ATP-binding protein [Paenibacillus sp. FSL R10-2734]|uniref:ABC transporter ATP-binding protein n=1 Tax=Paenibacillus sp. FSL R10-2734 TaxID=2954691 RepID=UPI0030DDDC7B